jgi:hypothetical protein
MDTNIINEQTVANILFLLQDNKNLPILQAYLKVHPVNMATLLEILRRNHVEHPMSTIEEYLISTFEGESKSAPNTDLVNTDLHARIKELNKLIEILHKSNDEKAEKINAQNDTISNQDKIVSDLQEQIAELQETVERRNNLIRRLDVDVESFKNDIINTQTAMGQTIEDLREDLAKKDNIIAELKKELEQANQMVIVASMPEPLQDSDIKVTKFAEVTNTKAVEVTEVTSSAETSAQSSTSDDTKKLVDLAIQNMDLSTQLAELKNTYKKLSADYTDLYSTNYGLYQQIESLEKKYEQEEKNFNLYLLKLDVVPIHLLEAFNFEIYQGTYESFTCDLYKESLKNPKSVLNAILGITRYPFNVDNLINFMDRHEFTDYQTIINKYLSDEFYLEADNSAVAEQIKELMRRKNILTFEKDFEITKAKYIIKKYSAESD